MSMKLDRRSFLVLFPQLATSAFAFASGKTSPLANEVGVTTGSFMRHLSVEKAEGKLRLLDLPRIMRDELGMRVIDLMTACLPSLEMKFADEFRAAAEAAGCIVTNLKMNNPGIDMAGPDAAERKRALAEYKRMISLAARLGARWARPLPCRQKPDIAIVAAGYRELIDHAAPLGIELLVENYGWMQDDPNAVPSIIQAAGKGIHAQPDTRNWTDEARYEGLEKAFPFAVSCDFKPFTFEADGGHPRYDLKRCFQLGWKAGFRGPWCIEYFAPTLKQQLADMIRIRDDLKKWMAEPLQAAMD
jgi:hypothetical protein